MILEYSELFDLSLFTGIVPFQDVQIRDRRPVPAPEQYILLFQHFNDDVTTSSRGIDSFKSVRHISLLRMLVQALLRYQIKRHRMSIPALGCCKFLKIRELILDGWMAIIRHYTRQVPCPVVLNLPRFISYLRWFVRTGQNRPR